MKLMKMNDQTLMVKLKALKWSDEEYLMVKLVMRFVKHMVRSVVKKKIYYYLMRGRKHSAHSSLQNRKMTSEGTLYSKIK